VLSLDAAQGRNLESQTRLAGLPRHEAQPAPARQTQAAGPCQGTPQCSPLPRQIGVDNGPELISSKLVAWCDTHQIRLHLIQPGKPMQNGYIERFNKSFRDEVLDANLFGSLTEVREAVYQWMIDYNEKRSHDSLGNLPPSLYRQQLTKTETKPARSSTFQMCH
jgi:putative transposase